MTTIKLHWQPIGLLGTREDFISAGILFHVAPQDDPNQYGIVQMDFPLKEEDIEFFPSRREAIRAGMKMVRELAEECKRWS